MNTAESNSSNTVAIKVRLDDSDTRRFTIAPTCTLPELQQKVLDVFSLKDDEVTLKYNCEGDQTTMHSDSCVQDALHTDTSRTLPLIFAFSRSNGPNSAANTQPKNMLQETTTTEATIATAEAPNQEPSVADEQKPAAATSGSPTASPSLAPSTPPTAAAATTTTTTTTTTQTRSSRSISTLGDATTFMMKVLVLGTRGCGKTSLAKRYVDDTFTDGYKMTVGVDFFLKELQVGDLKVAMQIWDTAGQERFANMAPTYYRNAAGVMLVCSDDIPDSLVNTLKWKEHVEAQNPGKTRYALALNKCDRQEETRTSDADLESFCKENGISCWYRCSAKTGENVELAFETLVKGILQVRGPVEIKPKSVVVSDSADPIPSSHGCC